MHDSQQPQDLDAANEMVAAVVTASRVLVAVSARSLAAIEEALTVPQFRMLVVLDTGGPVNLSGLAEQLAVNPSTALRMVDRLSAAGMVERTQDPGDRRLVVLAATAAGRQVVRQVTERRQAEITRIVSAMAVDHRGAMIEALEAFARAAGEEQINPAAYTGQALPGWS
ncbi:MarR family winged helix-turn-helix transcriptional regulator [Streptacidiphilus carbonis]|uniref:MarR family winged helix-turn-helix transcriptional regulator n=1 Tax=Streptacidiphilus carbonis TaxID=105422 RepID=UPI0005AB15E9|nr:MarR family transcriptional regulator [Streptacidiphilus carbonis]